MQSSFQGGKQPDTKSKTSPNNLRQTIEEFYFKEARLLDSRELRKWLDLFTEDSIYWMPVLYTREAGGEEIAREGDSSWFHEDKPRLTLKVERILTEYAWSENPPSRTCHLISNVLVEPSKSAESVNAYSNFLVYQNRLESDTYVFAGRREDVLRKVDGEWKIAFRKIILLQNLLSADRLTVFL